jgi:hypothetical protein
MQGRLAPPETVAPKEYQGEPRLIVPIVGILLETDEALKLKAVFSTINRPCQRPFRQGPAISSTPSQPARLEGSNWSGPFRCPKRTQP